MSHIGEKPPLRGYLVELRPFPNEGEVEGTRLPRAGVAECLSRALFRAPDELPPYLPIVRKGP